MELVNLPEVIFPLIQSYLTNDDYHFLLNTSKNSFADLKKRSIYFVLNEESTKQYLTDKTFQSVILSKVENGWKQIIPACDYWNFLSIYNPTIPCDCSRFLPFIQLGFNEYRAVLPDASNPSMLKIFKTIDLKEIGDLVSHVKRLHVLSPHCDLSQFKYIPDVTLSSPQDDDFSIFSKDHQKRLSISFCNNLKNVSSFQGIHTLRISNASNLEDISPLHGIYDLTIVSCPKVKDISALGNHNRLELGGAYQLVGYESLVGIPHVSLMACNITNLTVLRDAKTIELKYCDKIKDVNPIKNAKQITLRQNNHITNILELSHVYDLTINESNFKLQEINNLRNYRLTIDFPSSLKDHEREDADFLMNHLSFSDNIRYLTLRYPPCAFLQRLEVGSLSFPKDLQSLTIDQSSSRFRGIQGLEHIPIVRLTNIGISAVSGLRRNRCVELRHCIGIEDVSCLVDVLVLTIEKCSGISDDNLFSKVPRLKFTKDCL